MHVITDVLLRCCMNNHVGLDIKIVSSYLNFPRKFRRFWICSWFRLVSAFRRALALILKGVKVESSPHLLHCALLEQTSAK